MMDGYQNQIISDESSVTTPIPSFYESFGQQQPSSSSSIICPAPSTPIESVSNNNPLWAGNSPSVNASGMVVGQHDRGSSGSLSQSADMYHINSVDPQSQIGFGTSVCTDVGTDGGSQEDDFVSSLLNISVLPVMEEETMAVVAQVAAMDNINSVFFNHPASTPQEEFIISNGDSFYSTYSYGTEEKIIPPGSSDSYFPMEEVEIESSDSEGGPMHIGGYDYEFVRSKEVEDEDLVCPICKLVSRDPQQSECCGKVFCKVCVDKLKRSNSFDPKCPNCREEPVSLYADKRSSRSILNLKVYCKRRRKGCPWCGPLSEAEKHPETCRHQRVPCTNGCGKKPQRRHVDKHVKRFCANRQFQCEDCKEIGQWAYIMGEHMEKCPEKVVKCLNEGCGYRVCRQNLEEHVLNCPKKLLHCSYSDIGCVATCRREEMTDHENESMTSHLECAIKVARAFVSPHRDHLLQVAPVVIRIPNFSHSKELRSHPFLTSLNGYKMCLLLDKQANCIEFKFCLMPGSYDSNLSWPFCGKMTLLLLNQKEDRHHHEMSVNITNENSIPKVVNCLHSDFGESVVVGRFDQSKPSETSPSTTDWHMSLELENSGYLLDDVMSVRVSHESFNRKSHSGMPSRKKNKHSHKHQ